MFETLHNTGAQDIMVEFIYDLIMEFLLYMD